MEAIIAKMQNEKTGLTVKDVKGLWTKIPSVFTGSFYFKRNVEFIKKMINILYCRSAPIN